MRYSEFGYLLIGMASYFILRVLILLFRRRLSTNANNSKQIEFILFVGSLIFISIGFVFTFYSIRVTAGNTVTSDDLALFEKWIQNFTYLTWFLVGIGLGAIVMSLTTITTKKKLTKIEEDEIKIIAYFMWKKRVVRMEEI